VVEMTASSLAFEVSPATPQGQRSRRRTSVLAVTSELPWLIIDDPVQSMDEVHVSHFAALLRTLSKSHNRQIILAMHERPLFDYLALELSPAYSNDRLLTIALGQAADGRTTLNYEPPTWEPDKAIVRDPRDPPSRPAACAGGTNP